MPDTVLLDVEDGIARLTLNRPDKLNALNYAMIDRLMERLDAIEGADEILSLIHI